MLTLRDTVALSDLEEGALLLDTARGVYWHLNEAGARIVRGIKNGETVDDISFSLADELGVERERVREDTLCVLRAMKKARLLEGRFE